MRLQLVWREWSRDLNEPQITQNRILRFSGIEDLDATLPVEAQEESVSSGWEEFISKVGRLIFGVRPPPQTARELIACINARGPEMGEPLYGLEASQEGFILETHLVDDFYIRCDSVKWD